MQQADWFFKSDTAPAAYADASSLLEFGFRASSMKIKAAGALTFSFDGKDDHGVLEAADGFQDFSNIAKGKIYLKGGVGYTINAWAGSTD